MNEVTLPPSPNWYLGNVLACSRRGTVAWGARNFVVIGRPNENNIMQYSIVKDYFKDKVVTLAFCPKLDSPDSPDLLICGGDDSKVRILNAYTLELIAEFCFANESKLTAGVDWSARDNNLACAVNSDGFLMYCNVRDKTSKIVSLGKLTATCLACCPHDSNLIALGTKSGLVYIIQYFSIVQKETILYRMRGHNEDIVSLSWCPSQMNVFQRDEERDLLLASGAKDRSVYIWRTGRDGRYETVIHLPNLPVTPSSHKSKLNSINGTWIAVCWIEPNVLLTSSLWGELLSWDLSNKTKPECKVFHTFHNRGLFSIAAVPNYNATPDNLKTDSELKVWSLAQDRWVVGCKRNNDSTKPPILEHKIPTQGGFIYCMSPCPIDTSRIAFGVGDMMLRVWNLSEPHTTTFDMVMHWQMVKGKIRAISWFPEDESTIAFGTGEGRVGVFDAIGTNKPPILYRQYHRNTIYKLEWAKLNSEYFLFSCAEGELIRYKKSSPNDEPMSIIKKGCLEFSWKSNLCLAIALENGSIIFYDQMLNKRGNTIHILRTVVNCLAWHPDSTMADEWTSPFANYLAVASDSCSILIYDMSKLLKELKDNGDVTENRNDKDAMHKLVTTLNGHFEKVVCLAWSPHFSGYLVSGSYDNIAQVWNVEKEELIGTYMGHDGPILSCMWSPLKPQLIMTGSSDFTLHIWNYTSPAQSPRQLSDIKAEKKKHKQQKKSLKNKMDNNENNNETMSNPISPSAEATQTKLKSSKRKEKKSYFPKYDKLIKDKNQILNFIKHDMKSSQIKEGGAIPISLFCEKEDDVYSIVSNEKTQDNLDIVTEINLWCDELKDHLNMAASAHELNDFLVSLAPSVSMKMWREMCEVYAQQLIEGDNPGKAVTYLLSIHKIYEALEVLLNTNMYKEAYALGRLKLDADDAFLNKILESWAKWATVKGHLEQAAQCHVKLGQFDEAATILSRRKDLHCLEVASELAFLSGNEEFGMSLTVDAMTRALMKLDWSKARSLIKDIRQVQYLNVHIDAHETIMSTYSEETELDMMKIWLEGKKNRSVLQILKEKYDTSYYDVLYKKNDININVKNISCDKTMEIIISYQIALAAMCDAKEAQLKHLTAAINNVFEFENLAVKYGSTKKEGFFTHVLTILDTKKPTDKDSIYAENDYPVSQSIRAYLCVGLLNWLSKYSEKLSDEEETQFMQLVLNLLNDIINETNISHQKNVDRYNELEEKIMILAVKTKNETEDGDNYRDLEKEAQELKFNINKFNEERVYTPNLNTVLEIAHSVAIKLRDSNQFQLLQFCNNLTKETVTVDSIMTEEDENLVSLS
ncbi:gem-associated protein 5 isoform X2 [Monomorium pharaonis]|uniref:gem-associated protein 5 isoform X2 n=1 Tax=Monomorium pharaonis TaxID=307658 RepID=UPI001746426E|nr:gem-associated protein 5 isoform X2 [Monomorium pharaonis]